MPRYFFSLVNGESSVTDETGQELPDLESARRTAFKAAGEIIADELALGRERVDLTIFIEDGAGERLLTLPLTLKARESPG